MAKHDRFQIVYTQGITDVTRVLLDTQTGVMYLQAVSGYAGGLTPLLGRDGKPLCWSMESEE